MDPVIRKATIDDLAGIQRLNSDLFEFDRERDPNMNFDWPYTDGEEYFRKRINGEGFVLVAEVDQKLVGYLCGDMLKTESFHTTVRSELDNMYIDPEYRNSGLGREMVEQLFAWSKERGAQQVFVTAFWGNDNAVNFYQALGFKPYFMALQAEVSEVVPD